MQNLPDNFHELNMKRCIEHFKINPEPFYFTTAMAEELGEICGAIKKLHRGFNEREKAKIIAQLTKEEHQMMFFDDTDLKAIWRDRKESALKKEVADLFIYLSLFATHLGIDINTATIKKFNEVSKEMDLPKEFFIEQ